MFLRVVDNWLFVPCVVTSVQTLEVQAAEVNSGRRDIFVQADGEHLGFLPAKFSILPGQVDFIIWNVQLAGHCQILLVIYRTKFSQ